MHLSLNCKIQYKSWDLYHNHTGEGAGGLPPYDSLPVAVLMIKTDLNHIINTYLGLIYMMETLLLALHVLIYYTTMAITGTPSDCQLPIEGYLKM